jgi:acyl-coenzyme A synthetase/AMP-(fatty) acid ligase
VGGDVCPLQLQEEFSAAFGVPLRSVWASTEAIACLTYGLEPGPIFRVASGTEIRLVNDHHAPVAIGEIGELTLRSGYRWRPHHDVHVSHHQLDVLHYPRHDYRRSRDRLHEVHEFSGPVPF